MRAPAGLAFTENFTLTGNEGRRTAPLTDIKAVLYGALYRGNSFPTCPAAKIANARSDAACPKGALIATGAITAVLGPQDDASVSAPGTTSCNPLLHTWNGGRDKVVFFLSEEAPNHLCANGAITTGAVGPFTGKVIKVGNKLVLNTPVPSFVSFPLAGIEVSLTSERLRFLKVAKRVHASSVSEIAAIGCKAGSRRYSVTFTAEATPDTAPQLTTITGAQHCTM